MQTPKKHRWQSARLKQLDHKRCVSSTEASSAGSGCQFLEAVRQRKQHIANRQVLGVFASRVHKTLPFADPEEVSLTWLGIPLTIEQRRDFYRIQQDLLREDLEVFELSEENPARKPWVHLGIRETQYGVRLRHGATRIEGGPHILAVYNGAVLHESEAALPGGFDNSGEFQIPAGTILDAASPHKDNDSQEEIRTSCRQQRQQKQGESEDDNSFLSVSSSSDSSRSSSSSLSRTPRDKFRIETSRFVSPAAFVNDWRTLAGVPGLSLDCLGGREAAGGHRRRNCEFRLVLERRWPHIVLVSLVGEILRPGDELLCDLGPFFFQRLQERYDKLSTSRRSTQAQQQQQREAFPSGGIIPPEDQSAEKGESEGPDWYDIDVSALLKAEDDVQQRTL
uniref:Uncharacterized protein n=1 Tax=Chromera velia CCMP2878 TaxID=1169474 RepID=A0A0G4GFU0_9ALVE|eukprot:Cvel_21702.t1-p1 / transcript=Cvel_21702.t1 / gene=Cvel_21702 / organism=Chromera_velia_CCMP2878 / gene_product=hypothetical protein / transcript_product=hypothetical protein / location=Cvel_scaffold2058:14199-17561(-) / protein_length=393 / sequence_SO=supercontig / SO=protein_coding / is_pseudo=false